MRKYWPVVFVILLFLPIQIHAQAHRQTPGDDVDYAWVPRVSAYEAYVKYKAGKALIFHGGGAKFGDRHIVGAYNLDVKNREPILRKFPKKGIEIFTYCY
jgi:hypothetical protein